MRAGVRFVSLGTAVAWLGAIALLVGLPSAGAFAQQAGAGAASDVEEIVVTARKREEAIQDIPFSISAQTAEQLRNAGAQTLEDVSQRVASFSVQNLGPGQSQVAIRGVSAGQIVRDQPGVKEQVGIYLDESPVSLSLFTPDLDLFDLQRVEVLRTPQGTLFGAGSLTGTVRYITRQPVLDEWEAFGEASSGFVMDGEADFDGSIRGGFNAPVVPGTVALRGGAYYTKFGGFIDAVTPDLSIDRDVNDGERWGGRLALLIQPVDQLRITPRLLYQEVEVDGFNRNDEFNILANPFTTTRPPVDLSGRRQFRQLEEEFSDEFFLGDLTVEYDFGRFALTSITTFTDRDILQIRDATQLTGSITGQDEVLTGEGNPGYPESVYTLDAPLDDATEAETFSQEVRLASVGDERIDWVVGVFYADNERDYGQTLFVDGFEDATEAAGDRFEDTETSGSQALVPTDVLFFSDLSYELEQLAFFGEASYAITESIDVTAGVRWFDFEEDRTLTFDGIFAAENINVPASTESDGWSPRFMVSWEANEDLTLNAQVANGFRLGGINDPLNEPICNDEDLATFGGNPDFEDEEVWNYELNAKSTIWGGRGTLNGALFYTDIEDLQATLDAGSCSSRVIVNVPDARTMGAEVELDVQPTDHLGFGLAASYIDSELRSTVRDINGNVLGALESGNRLPTVPRFQLSANLRYERPINDRLDGFGVFSFQHVGSRYTQFGDQASGFGVVDISGIGLGDPPPGTTIRVDPKLDDYQLGNLRFGVRTEAWEVAAFVNNLWDEEAELALDRERGGRARLGYLTNPARTIGVSARVRW